ncbi:MAG: HD domain-containing protein [Planctomycetota bacterium]|nr:HD domain-containing protein [Planctomycetota bacterium]MDI6787094.1 HD domain-containing protein [Planctomycetota bacterium]
MNVFVKKFILALSLAFELLSKRIYQHQQRTTIIALNLANELELSHPDLTNLFYAGLLHDIGTFSSPDRMGLMKFDYSDILYAQSQSESDYNMLSRIDLLKDTAEIIRYHHYHWSGPNQNGMIKDAIPLLSQIIHLADRMELLIDESKDILEQIEPVINKIKQYSSSWFNPMLVEKLQEATRHKIFWVNLTAEFTDKVLEGFAPEDQRKITINSIIEVAYIFAQIVDYKSHHTKSHSIRVSDVAVKLGEALRWTGDDLKRLTVAALLHDLGKLSVPDEILDKQEALTKQEYAIIKRHPYFSYIILNSIPNFDELAEWALFHHENIGGNGYPLGVNAENIPPGARIISVADKFSAMTEDRPYHKRLSKEEAIKVLEKEAKRGMIDKKVVDVLKRISHKFPF